MSTAPWELPLTMLDGRATTLGEWRGQVLLIVNVASRCGMTPQYAGLETLYRRHRDQGFTVLGVPCDQFAHQEPGSAAEIAAFCERNYGVSFPLLAKAEVNGSGTHPLYRWLKRERPLFLWLGTVQWNFTKFLVGRDGGVLARYGPKREPDSFAAEVAAAVAR